MEWFRLYQGTPTDPKLYAVSREAKTSRPNVLAAWICCLDYASKSSDRGNISDMSSDMLAYISGLKPSTAASILGAFKARGMITPEGRISAWEKRQKVSDDAGSRKRKQRQQSDQADADRNETEWNDLAGPFHVEDASVNALENNETRTVCHGTKPPRTEQNRTEKITPLSANADIPPSPEPPPAPVAPDGAAAPADAVAVRVSGKADFEKFWSESPRKIGKAACEKKFASLVKSSQVTVDELVAGIRRYSQHISSNAIEDRFIVHPITWLTQGRWADELNDHGDGRRRDEYISPHAQIITEHMRRLDNLPDERTATTQGGNAREPGAEVVPLLRCP